VEKIYAQNYDLGKHNENRPLSGTGNRWGNNIKMNLKDTCMWFEEMNMIELMWFCNDGDEFFCSIRQGNLLTNVKSIIRTGGLRHEAVIL
jgi:hypothetical protein